MADMADSSFFNYMYMRMEPNMFDEILNRVGLESKRVTPTSVQVGQNAKSEAEAWQKPQDWLCLNSTVATEACWS